MCKRGKLEQYQIFWVWASKGWIQSSPTQVCRWVMRASGIDFQTHKTFSTNLFFAEYARLRCKKEIAGKAENCCFFFEGQSRKLLYNQFTQDDEFVSYWCGWKTFIRMQANVFWAVMHEPRWVNGCHLIFYRNCCASAMLIRMICTKYSLNHKIYRCLRQLKFILEYRHIFELTKPLSIARQARQQ